MNRIIAFVHTIMVIALYDHACDRYNLYITLYWRIILL